MKTSTQKSICKLRTVEGWMGAILQGCASDGQVLQDRFWLIGRPRSHKEVIRKLHWNERAWFSIQLRPDASFLYCMQQRKQTPKSESRYEYYLEQNWSNIYEYKCQIDQLSHKIHCQITGFSIQLTPVVCVIYMRNGAKVLELALRLNFCIRTLQSMW